MSYHFSPARRLRGVLIVTTALSALAGGAFAASVDHYTVTKNGVTLEISAPRADIIRVRAGDPNLPEDASWAVAQDVRAKHVPLDVSEAAGVATVSTGEASVKIDETTLAVTVYDKAGHVVLADAKGAALQFDPDRLGQGFRLRKAMPVDAHYFGLGDKTGPLDRRNEAFTLWNTDNFGFGVATDPLYKSIPFVLGVDEKGQSFGFFMDNTWRSTFDFGKTEPDALDINVQGGGVDYYVLTGATPRDIVEDYTWLTGRPPLTPEWALGFQQSHWSYMTQAEAKGIADRLRADKIPSDAIWLDIDFQDKLRPFTVNTQTYPDLPKLVADLKAENMHLVVITDLHIAAAPNQGYAPYDDGMKKDIFVHRADGSTFVGPVWPGDAVFPDFSRPAARDWWGEQYKAFVGMGVSGFWNDMNEPSVFNTPTKTMPLDNVHRIEEPGFTPRNASHAEMHNVFGMLNTEATYDGVLKLNPDQRPFVMTRASYAGGQKFAATWTGDNSSSWAHLQLSVSQLVNLGLSGFAYAGDDIGGFAGDQPSAELLTRWIEVGAFNPIFRDHYQKDKPAQEVWVNGPEQEAIRRRYIDERYRLMPYIYSPADENSRTGLPIMRPVFMDYPKVVAGGDHLGGTDGQFMLGADLLIAPPATWESPAPYKVTLPGSGWYDYWSGEKLASDSTMETPKLDRLPVFVRPGSIIPKQPLVQSTGETPVGPLTLEVYPGDDCRGFVYQDDGISFAYKSGHYLRQSFTCKATATGLSFDFGAREGDVRPWWTGVTLLIHGQDAAAKATLNGKALKAGFDAAAHTLRVDLPDQSGPAAVIVGR